MSEYEHITREEAADVVSHIVSQRLRWGKNYRADDVGVDKTLDALVALARAETSDAAEARETITLLRRQAAASNARETKMKKRIAELTGKEEADDE